MDTHFDALILGTSLTHSILAAALSKAGYKVAHVDKNPYYGARDASLSVEELIQWADSRPLNISSIMYSGSPPPNSKQYSLSLAPSILPATGPLIDSLIASGVSKYGGFRLLQSVNVYDASSQSIHPVPGSKEDVFKNKSISLIDKRRLMRFLMWAADANVESSNELEGKNDWPFPQFLRDTFNLPAEMLSMLTYALAFCTSPSDPTLPAVRRIRRHLLSTGRYGPSPFIVGHYGGAGEIAQGFCRTSAVNGGIYILGKPITSLSFDKTSSNYSVTIDEIPGTLSSRIIISSEEDIPAHLQHMSSQSTTHHHEQYTIARGIAILNLTPTESLQQHDPPMGTSHRPIETSVLIFPPTSTSPTTPNPHSAVTVFITGADTMSCPPGQWVLYLSTPLSPNATNSLSAQSILQPYLDTTLSSLHEYPALTPLFAMFYVQHPPGFQKPSKISEEVKSWIIPPESSVSLSGSLDSAASGAEICFKSVIDALRRDGIGSECASWAVADDGGAGASSCGPICFWPVIDDDQDDT